MARDTDRKKISEAFRLVSGQHSWPRRQWTLCWTSPLELTATDNIGTELNLTYSLKGRLVGLVHWQPLPENPRYAHREPIYTRKREYVIDVLGGNHSGNLRWRLAQAENNRL